MECQSVNKSAEHSKAGHKGKNNPTAISIGLPLTQLTCDQLPITSTLTPAPTATGARSGGYENNLRRVERASFPNFGLYILTHSRARFTQRVATSAEGCHQWLLAAAIVESPVSMSLQTKVAEDKIPFTKSSNRPECPKHVAFQRNQTSRACLSASPTTSGGGWPNPGAACSRAWAGLVDEV